MAREIKISAAYVSDDLNNSVGETMILCWGGYTRSEGFGAYIMRDGEVVEERSVTWHVSTSDDRFVCAQVASDIARMYCRKGDQESIFYRDPAGECFLVYADGVHFPLVSP